MAIWNYEQDLKRLADQLVNTKDAQLLNRAQIYSDAFQLLPDDTQRRIALAVRSTFEKEKKAEQRRLRKLIRYRLDRIAEKG